jgi:hypothetical protein
MHVVHLFLRGFYGRTAGFQGSPNISLLCPDLLL